MKKQKVIVVFALLLFIVLGEMALSQNTHRTPDELTGLWITEYDDRIEFYKKDGLYFGRLTVLAEPHDENGNPWKDSFNPDQKLRNRSLKGIDVVLKMKYVGDGEWKNGAIYDPEEGKTYKGYMEIKSDGKLKVTASWGFFSYSEIWERK